MGKVDWLKPEYLKLFWVCGFFAILWLFNFFVRFKRRPFKTLGSRFSFFGETKAQAAVVVLLCGFVLALARPVAIAPLIKENPLDILVLLDATLSMGAQDIWGGRFGRARREIRSLVNHMREGDRLAMMRFGNGIGVESFLSTDYRQISFVLNNIEIDKENASTWNTDIVFALDGAFGVLSEQKKYDAEHEKFSGDRRMLVFVFSDGDDNSSGSGSYYKTLLEEKISKFKESGWLIYTIGIGTKAGAVLSSRLEQKTWINDNEEGGGWWESRDAEDVKIFTRLNDEILKLASEFTGGKYFAINNSSVATAGFYKEVFSGERVFGAAVVEEKTELYWYVLLVCGIVLAVLIFLF